MKNIISLLKESKVASAILLTATVFIVGSISFVAFNTSSNVYELEAAGKTYNQTGEVLFPIGTKYEKNWDGTADANGSTVAAGAPIIYDDKSLVSTEEGIVIFPDTSDVYVFDEYTQVANTNGTYAIQEEGGTNVQSPEMIIKTKSNYHIFLSNNIEVISNDKVVEQDDNILVTKQNNDGSVTIYGEENKNILSSDLKIKTSQGLFDYSTLYYDAEVDTNVARLTVGDNEVNKMAFKNNINKPEGDKADAATDGKDVANASNANGTANADGTQGSTSGKSSGSSSAGSSGGINGLFDLFQEAENQKSITPPRIITSVMPGFSSVNVKAEVFDPSNAITGKVEFYLYDEKGNIIAYKEEDVKSSIDVTFDSLTSDTKYFIEVKANYTTSQGDEFKGTFSSEHFRTSRFNLNISVPKQTENSLTLNVKTPKEQNITYAKIAVTEKSLGMDTLVGEYEIDLDQATTPEGETIQIDALNSNSQFNITVEEVTIGGAVYDVDQVVVTQTLKSAPIIQAPIAQVDTFASAFRVISPNIVDPDNSITSLQYQVYEVKPDGSMEYVTSVEKEANSINEYANIYIDGSVLKRNTTYRFRTVVKGYDNLNNFEIISDYSGNFIMQGVEPPVVIFENNSATDIDFNRIKVNVELVDKGATIVGNARLEIYKGSDKLSTEYIIQPGKNDGLEFTGLTSNTTYKLQVVADVNLQDGSGVRRDTVIGQTLITTKVIGNFDAAFIMDPYCPLIDPNVPGEYDSCIGEDGAVIKMVVSGETVPSIKTMTIRILDSSNNVVLSQNLTPPDIDELKQTGVYRMKIPAGSLKSNQKYTIEIYQVTDSANNLPFTVSTPNDFRTKKTAPSVNKINVSYNENQGKIFASVDQFKDVDSGFQSLKYELYTVDSNGDLDKPIKEEKMTSQNNLNTAFIVDGSLIPRGDTYAVKTSVTYNNNYYPDEVVLDTSAPIVVDYLRPKTKIENIVITDSRIDIDVTIEDLDNVIGMVDPSRKVTIELKDASGATIKTTTATANNTTKVTFDGLTPSTTYKLVSSAEIMTLSGKINYQILNFEFTTKINQAELPTINLDSFTLDYVQGMFNYVYTIKDQHKLITSATLKYMNDTNGELIYATSLNTSGTNVVADEDVKKNAIKKNVNYKIVAQLEYVEPTIESFNTVDTFQLNDHGRVMTVENGNIRATTNPNIYSKINIVAVAGFPGQFRIQIGVDKNMYISINNNDQLVTTNGTGSATKFEFVNYSGQYAIKETGSDKYITYDNVVGNGYKVDTDVNKAIKFSMFKVQKVDSNEKKVFLPSAPLPDWQTVSQDKTSDSITMTGDVWDSYDLISQGTLFFEVWDLNGNRMYRKEFKPEIEETFVIGSLKPMTEYKVVVKATVDKQEINSKAVDDFIIYEEVIETDPLPPPFTKISASFDIPNRNIVITDDLVDTSGVYDAVVINFYEGNTLVDTYSSSYKYVDGVNTTTIGFQNSNLEVNKTYKVEMQFKSNRFSDSKVISTNLYTTYPLPTATFKMQDLDDTTVTLDSMFADPNKLILKNTAIILENKTNPAVANQRKNVSQTEMTRTTFTGLEANNKYKASLVATVDIDGKGTEQEVVIATQNVETLEPIPTVDMMFAEYIRTTETLNVTTDDATEERKIKTMDLEIQDSKGVQVYELKGTPYSNDVDFKVASNLLVAGSKYKIIITYNILLDNGTKMTLQESQIIKPGVNSVMPSNAFEDEGVVKLDNVYKVTYYQGGNKVKTERTDEIIFDDSFSKVVIKNGDEETEINNNKYVEKSEEVNDSVNVKMVNDEYVVQTTGDTKVVVEQMNSKKIAKVLGLDKKTYTSEELDGLVIPKDQIENYNIYEKGDVNEKN